MKTLEGSKLFPIVAWGLVILFAGFTTHLALSLDSFADDLNSPRNIEQQLNAGTIGAAES